MSTPAIALTHHTEHVLDIDAPPERVYPLVADVRNWPRIFPPTLHVELLEPPAPDGAGRAQERLRLWATANGEIKTWTSRRELDAGALRVRFRQDVSQAPVAGMAGEWIVTGREGGGSTVTLTHDFAAVGDDPDAVRWIEEAVERNSTSELGALRSAAEHGADSLSADFTDSVLVEGLEDPAEVFAFVDRADAWPERLPHVARVELIETTPGLQWLGLETRAPDGSTHHTRSARVVLGPDRIVYKQTELPALLSLHLGEWTFRAVGGGVLASSRHVITVRPERVTEILGPDAGPADALAYVRTALSKNSLTTLGHARELLGKGAR
ncbi:SRPBCC family protein [Pseudonocardia ailaonensis]|uniref:SRPBCC family protein n=1 Tax=Pseudonocardia ailaonensis TaxID=367279 RepID=A0ABN2N4E7_9PSEU